MSELISSKEALIALANGNSVQGQYKEQVHENCWFEILKTDQLAIFDRDDIQFRLKPRTITINGVEMPSPFNPKEGEECCYLSDESVDGFHTISYNPERYAGMVFGLYRPSDVEQVVAALRSAFNVK